MDEIEDEGTSTPCCSIAAWISSSCPSCPSTNITHGRFPLGVPPPPPETAPRSPARAATEADQPEEGPRFCSRTPVPVSAADAGKSLGALRSLGRSEPAIRADSSTISSIACSRSRTVSASHRRNCARRLPSSSSGSSRCRYRSDPSSFLSIRIHLLVPKLRLGVCRAKPEMRGLAPRKRQEETHRSIPVGEPRGKSHPAKARWRAGSESHVNHRGDLGTKLGGATL